MIKENTNISEKKKNIFSSPEYLNFPHKQQQLESKLSEDVPKVISYVLLKVKFPACSNNIIFPDSRMVLELGFERNGVLESRESKISGMNPYLSEIGISAGCLECMNFVLQS